jgi:hypothetical protein
MTEDKGFKRLVRERAARTGESYAAARRVLRGPGRESPREVARYDLWYARASQGYSGRGARPSGFEHHSVTVTAAGVRVEAEIAFKNFGVHRTSVTSDGVDCRAVFDYGEGAVTIDSLLADRNWSGTIRETGEEVIVAAVGVDAHPIPSVAARFLPLVLPFDAGELADYVTVPEDLSPVWRPETFKSWFPLMGASRESLIEKRVVIGVGEEELRVARKRTTAFRYDHVALDGTRRASTWRTDDGVVRYEQSGCILDHTSADAAAALDPGPS